MGKLFHQLQRRKVFRVAGIYVVAAWAVIQVADTVSPLMDLPETVPRLVLFVSIFLFPVALILAWFFQIGSNGIELQPSDPSEPGKILSRKQAVGYSSIGVAGLLAVVFLASRFVEVETPVSTVSAIDTTEDAVPALSGPELVASKRSIAVLPFDNFSTDEETGFFAQGLSEEVLDQLVENSGLNIASRTATFQAAERDEELDVIAEQLQVAYMLEGSVRRLGGDDVRITAQLIRADDGFHLWSKTYQESFAEGFRAQAAVAANIAFVAAEELKFDVWRNYDPIVNDDFAGIDPQAIKYYFDAEYEYLQLTLGERDTHGSYERYHTLATEIAPGFSLPYKELAWYYHQRLDRSIPPAEASLKAHAALDKALELDPDNVDLQFQLAQIYLVLDWNLAGVMEATEQMLSVDPNCPVCYLLQSGVASAEGRHAESRELRNFSLESMQGNEKIGVALIPAFGMLIDGEIAEVQDIIAEGLTLISDGPTRANLLQYQAVANIQLGNFDAARALIEDAWAVDNRSNGEFYVYLYARTGQDEKARAILTDQNRQLDDYFWLALAYLALGEIDNTFATIELGIMDRNISLAGGLRYGAYWDLIREDPRFAELLALVESMTTHTEQYLQEETRVIL